jgi:type II secretory pathway predicted ATPase ExeA
MGKTTLLYRFLQEVRDSARSVFLFDIDADCEPRDLVAYILRDIGITPGKTSSEMHEQLSGALVKETTSGRKFVVVIDEAQNLSDAVLERVRLLSNFETTRGKLLQIVLSGQPQLTEKLMKPSLVQLRQRVSTICRIDPLSVDETAAYINYRLQQVGYTGGPLFTEGAVTLIAEASQGTPRIINNLCFNALALCFALKNKQVNESMVSEVLADMDLTPPAKEPITAVEPLEVRQSRVPQVRQLTGRLQNPWIPAAAALLVMLVLGVFGFAALRSSQSIKSHYDNSLNSKALPASSSSQAMADAAEGSVPDVNPKTEPIEITVEPDQRLEEIAHHYLGGYDLSRLRQIQELNPKLKNPDHIETGQRLRLPPPLQVAAERAPASPSYARRLQ